MPTTVIKSKRKVGFELEMYSPTDISYQNFFWGETVDDGSINPPSSREPVEFRSNPVEGTELLKTVDGIHRDIIRKYRCGTNRSCGFHVHIDMNKSNQKQRDNIQKWWTYFEPAFYLLVPSWRRNSYWCRPLRVQNGQWPARDSALNPHAFSNHGTFEVRLHQGTTKKSNIKHWTHLLLLFFERFENETPPNDLPPASEAEQLLKIMLKEIGAPRSMVTHFRKKVREYAEA